MSTPISFKNFTVDLVRMFRDGEWMDVDGGDLENLCAKHGLCKASIATEEDCNEDWAQEWGVEPGDTFMRWDPRITKLLKGEENGK